MSSFTSDHASGDAFPVGTTTVTYVARDASGNMQTAFFTVTVNDNTRPTISGVPANIIINSNDANPLTCTQVATWTEPSASDNCSVSSFTSDHASGDAFPVGTTTVTYIAKDASGNLQTASFTVTVNDNTKPTISGVPSNIIINSNDANPLTCTQVATWTEPSASDNCSVSSFTSDHASGNPFPVGTTTVTYTAKDASGNVQTASFTVTVNDNTNPVISGMPANITLSACTANATWVSPKASDNCSVTSFTSNYSSGVSVDNGQTITVTYTATDASGNQLSTSFYVTRASALVASSSATPILCYGGTSVVTVNATGGTAPYSGTGTFNHAAGSYSYTVTDADGCTSTTTGTITEPTPLTASFTTNNAWLYYGYSSDQSATITATPSGGTAPYTVQITMNRGLIFNSMTSSGDEFWTSNGSTVGNTGPSSCTSISPGLTSGCYGSIPVSTISGIYNGSLSVNVMLMTDAGFTVTVTDANGCTYTSSYLTGGNQNGRIDAEDDRCFGGNSSVVKVTICHQTGSAKNPCVTLCVDQSAVNDHLSHGDFLGSCPKTGCAAPIANARVTDPANGSFDMYEVDTYPNPFQSTLSVKVTNPNNEEVTLQMMDITGRVIPLGKAIRNEDEYIVATDHIPGGLYFLRVNIGNFVKAIKVVKE
ncbi:MAG TPA: hypothetical protein DGG95_07580 [Cytophagales bacterium]|nr:hypothetical protein [Cytophagales bacterium]